MKKFFAVLVVALLTFSCSSRSGKAGSINPKDITYIKDTRTNLCFAVIGAKKGLNFVEESTSIGMSCVPCDSLKNVKVIEK